MNLKQLEAFVKIAELKSFSIAAKEIFITQPTISAHIAALEKELNVKLFFRSTKEVHITSEGEILLEYAKEMMDIQTRIYTAFKNDKNEQSIKIAASSVPAQYLLQGYILKCKQKKETVKFEISLMDSLAVIEAVFGAKVEIGLTGTKVYKKNCIFTPIYQDELVLITPNVEKYKKVYKKCNGVLNDVTWLSKEMFITREAGSGTKKESEKLLSELGVDLNSLNVVANMDNQEIIKCSVKNKIGISVISKLSVQEEVENNNLLAFCFPDENKNRQIYAVYNKEFRVSKIANLFLKAAKGTI